MAFCNCDNEHIHRPSEDLRGCWVACDGVQWTNGALGPHPYLAQTTDDLAVMERYILVVGHCMLVDGSSFGYLIFLDFYQRT